MADNEEGVDLSAEDFVDRLWLLALTLLLIMLSGENLVDRGRLEKTENQSPAKASRPNSGRLISWVDFTGL